MKKLLTSILLMGMVLMATAEKGKKEKEKVKAPVEDSLSALMEAYGQMIDSLEGALKYESGKIDLKNGVVQLNVPNTFRFLNAEQANHVITNIWGNPPQDDVLGMILPANSSPLDDSMYAFIVSFEEMGYVKDEDADDINYDDLLKEWQDEEKLTNKERNAAGYESIHIVGWAAKPFYDAEKKVLHWAKELEFEGAPAHTLNYDVRVLGRKGVLSLNAVSGMESLQLVQQDIDAILAMPEFTSGNKYSDFNPDLDAVAAVTVGGLVAGKVLAKVGFLALLLKGWKFILLGGIALWAGIKKFVLGRKKEEEEEIVQASDVEEATTPADENANTPEENTGEQEKPQA